MRSCSKMNITQHFDLHSEFQVVPNAALWNTVCQSELSGDVFETGKKKVILMAH